MTIATPRKLTAVTAFTWGATNGGDWSVASNWTQSAAPGTGSTAIIAGPFGRFWQVIRGKGSVAGLTLTGNDLLVGTFTAQSPGIGRASGNASGNAISSTVDLDAGASLSADTAAVVSSSLQVSGGSTLAVTGSLTFRNAYNLTVTDGSTAHAGAILLGGGVTINIDSSSSMTIGATTATTAAITVAAGASIFGQGTLQVDGLLSGSPVSGAIINKGAIGVAGNEGTLCLGSVTGTGTLQIYGLGSLALYGSESGNTIAFISDGGELDLSHAGSVTGTISGFGQTDAIEVKSSITSVRYVAATTGPAGGVLCLLSAGKTVGQLTLAGNYTGQVFHAHVATFASRTEITVTNVGVAASPMHFIGTPDGDTLYADAAGETLTGGAGADTLFASNFATIFSDTAAGLNGDSISGFSKGCKIDITDLLPAKATMTLIDNPSGPGFVASFDLTVNSGSQTVGMTVDGGGLPLNVTRLHLAADGHGGTAITYG
jgi:hypothetical protein